jgi:hypothetical protein
MNLDNLASMFSQRSGVQQSTASTIMSTIMSYMMQHFMQKGIGSFLNSGGSDKGSMQSALSQLDGNASNPQSDLVQQVKQKCNLRDDNEAKQYTQQAVGLLRNKADDDPQGLSSVFGSLGGQGGIGSMVGGLLGGGQDQKQKGGFPGF